MAGNHFKMIASINSDSEIKSVTEKVFCRYSCCLVGRVYSKIYAGLLSKIYDTIDANQ